MATAYDIYARETFKNPRPAAEEFAVTIPPKAAALIDWKKLRPEPTELVHSTIGTRLADLRFSAPLLGHRIALEFLFEHQSESDPLMPVRFHSETTRLWEAALGQKRTRVPLVLSVLLHNGESPWPAPLALWTAIDGGHELQRLMPELLLPSQAMFIDDLPRVTDKELRARPQSSAVRLALLTMKNVRSADAAGLLDRNGDLVRDVARKEGGTRVLTRTIRYMLEAGPATTVTTMSKVLHDVLGSKGREIAMTEGERLRHEGKKEGRKAGVKKGRKEGAALAARALLGILQARRLKISPGVRSHIETCSEIDVLERWIGRANAARSVAEVIAD